MKNKVTLVEVGLRDGLQNESVHLSTTDRIEFAVRLAQSGLRRIELGSFVRGDRVPQMEGSDRVIQKVLQLQKEKKISAKVEFSALVPNEKGMNAALGTRIPEIALFASCSESFSLKNINCSREESFQRFEPVMKMSRQQKVKVRGYLSVCFGCPYEGKVPEAQVVRWAKRMRDLGVYEISIGDTIGVAHPGQVRSLFTKLKKVIPVKQLAGHFHDTRGMSLANIQTALDLGVRVFDTSLGGLGGCPYAPGSAGNVATEDVVYLLHGMGFKTGVDLPALLSINQWISELMNKPLPSRLGRAGLLVPRGKVV